MIYIFIIIITLLLVCNEYRIGKKFDAILKAEQLPTVDVTWTPAPKFVYPYRYYCPGCKKYFGAKVKDWPDSFCGSCGWANMPEEERQKIIKDAKNAYRKE